MMSTAYNVKSRKGMKTDRLGNIDIETLKGYRRYFPGHVLHHGVNNIVPLRKILLHTHEYQFYSFSRLPILIVYTVD